MIRPSFFVGMLVLGGLMMNAQNFPRIGHDRNERFKQEIDFEARAKQVNAKGGLVGTNLPNPAKAPQVTHGWEMWHESISAGMKKLFFRNGNERLNFAYYYNIDIETTKKILWQMATNTNTTVIPYQLGPSDLGDISLVGKFRNSIKDTHRVMIWKKNLVVDISRDQSGVDIMGLARWIHDHLQLVPVEEVTKQIPVPGKIVANRTRGGVEAPMTFRPNESMTTIRCQVGEPLVIRIFPPAGTEPNRYDLEQDWVAGLFQPVGMEGLGTLERAIQPVKPGSAVYKYILIDRQTLLSFPGEIKIDVQP